MFEFLEDLFHIYQSVESNPVFSQPPAVVEEGRTAARFLSKILLSNSWHLVLIQYEANSVFGILQCAQTD